MQSSDRQPSRRAFAFTMSVAAGDPDLDGIQGHLRPVPTPRNRPDPPPLAASPRALRRDSGPAAAATAPAPRSWPARQLTFPGRLPLNADRDPRQHL
jgi:hypothetical protein